MYVFLMFVFTYIVFLLNIIFKCLPLFSGGDGMVISSSISHEIETSACDATFMCISSINGSCVIELIRNNERFSRSGAINSSIAFSNLLPSSFYSYVINFTNLQGGVSNYNFTTGKNSPCTF